MIRLDIIAFVQGFQRWAVRNDSLYLLNPRRPEPIVLMATSRKWSAL